MTDRLRFGRALVLLHALVCVACIPLWRNVEIKQGGFSLEMPATPERGTSILDTPQGPVTLNVVGIVAGRYNPFWIALYQVSYSEPFDVYEDQLKIEELLELERLRLVRVAGASPTGTKEVTIHSEQDITFRGSPGVAIELHHSDGLPAKARIYFANRRLYTLYAIDSQSRVARFFKSFDLRE